MFKKLVFICLVALCTSSNAKELSSEKFQIIANKLDTKGDIVTAIGDVVIFSPSYYGSAQKVVYNKKKETFEFFNDVLIVKDNSIQAQSEYAFLDNKNDALFQKPTLIFNNKSNLWMNSKDSKKQNDIVTLNNSILSSCDCEDPAWSIKSSSTEYNTETKWVNIFNPRLYIKNIPVFYFPYFGFSADNTRRTGLLIPTIGYGSEEGFIYAQPIYFAPADDYDFEFIPQIRTDRGKGLYSYFRYKPTEESYLRLGAGFFNEKDDYYKEKALEHQNHYGWEIYYTNEKILSDENSQDGLYADIRWLNDFEYRKLERKGGVSNSHNDEDEKKIESKINYFYNTPEYYGGVYFRYYLDKTLNSNEKTMQELPQGHFHKYAKPILLDDLLYSIDTRYTNYYRQDGVTANKYDISVPLSYSISLFDDYLQLNLKNETVFTHYKYDDTDSKLEDGTFIENITTVGLSTDLLKAYEDIIHTVNLSANYVDSATIKDDGDLYGINNDTNELSFFPISKTSRSIELALNQSFYDRDTLKQIINHKLKQSIVFDDLDNPELQNMENEIIYNYFYGTISNKVIYNHQDNTFTENSTSLTFNYGDFNLGLGYYMSKDTPNSGKEDLESYRINANYRISRDYSVGYYTNYNLKEDMRSRQGVLFSIMDDCWQIDLKYEKEVEAISSKIYDREEQDVLYVQILLKPIGGIKQQYTLEKTEE
ncbi:organic solvent tolerance protein [Malaciobacter molluscorum LMG 25693]|uniref:Lipooligosaccharide transport system, OM translocon component LptD n=1 Tax=Malaciobacter molluscorum LMG 25693 TaxID=870501 RepID=A0A2G1DGQ3_9BACT|nr:LPS-assembly protein LptD [Malaciobacter molluscorum]AXX92458.1 lipooligosaccharide transport system, OM translocon component LptD [Malaciobacter molluscorum LMG 25693]PHO17671.1 organic solvent tolerance protein [Malaciobacter molluscorum LMG 25693]